MNHIYSIIITEYLKLDEGLNICDMDKDLYVNLFVLIYT